MPREAAANAGTHGPGEEQAVRRVAVPTPREWPGSEFGTTATLIAGAITLNSLAVAPAIGVTALLTGWLLLRLQLFASHGRRGHVGSRERRSLVLARPAGCRVGRGRSRSRAG
jgi:hypothetical protein